MDQQVRIFDSLDTAIKMLPEGKPRKVIVRNLPYCFVRLQSDIRVFNDLCPHQRASLSGGVVTSFEEIVCPLHNYRYDLHLGTESNLRCEGLQFLKVTINDHGVYLHL